MSKKQPEVSTSRGCRSRRVPLFSLVVVFCVVIQHHQTLLADSQQLVSGNSGSTTAGEISANENKGSSNSVSSNKIGLAPHDRPACQLPFGAQRRNQVASSSGDPTNTLASQQSNGENSHQSGAAMVAPSVLSIAANSQAHGGSAGSNESSWLRSGQIGRAHV